ncbi:MAG: redox-regulated ATPase YchF [Candidatus Sungbacteria bacterium]|nr:redox-regulated ATPase YchF [Candidatus Sungbacteria bacterium]
MSLKIGIVGLPNVGKSTLFNALTKNKVDIANYPFCTIEPNVGVVEVPDLRLQKLAEFSRSKKVVAAVVEFVDIAGLVKGAAEGEGLGNKFLTHIAETNAIAEVVRVFEDSEIIHVAEKVDPASDIEVIEYELILKDLETVEKRLQTLEKEIKAQRKGAKEEYTVFTKAKEILTQGSLLSKSLGGSTSELEKEEIELLKQIQLLTVKPIIYCINASESHIEKKWTPEGVLKEKIGASPYVIISAKIESELSELSEEEKNEFLVSLGIPESGLSQLIRTGYKTLGLMTFFTTGEDETRAWTIPAGSTAPRAGRAIHSDFEEKFIRAEVIHWSKLLEAGSFAKARELGLIRTEGKEYVVKDGDVVEFKI